MKWFLFLFFLMIVTPPMEAQEVEFNWAKKIGGTNTESTGWQQVIDNQGNIYISGSFKGTCDFDPALTTANVQSVGGYDCFLAKLNKDGVYQWVKTFGLQGNDRVTSMSIDNLGNLYIVGYYNDSIDINPGLAQHILYANGEEDIFLLKLDSVGNYVWSINLGGNDTDSSIGICNDDNGNVYISGNFKDSLDFDPDTSEYYLYATNFDFFMARYSSLGELDWVYSLEGIWFSRTITYDNQGYLYYSGLFSGTVDFDPGASFFNLISTNSNSGFISKIDTSGVFVWVKQQFTESMDPTEIQIDGEGNIYATGSFETSLAFENDTTLLSNGGDDIYLAKFDTSGTIIWARQYGGVDFDGGNTIGFDDFNNVYFTGTYFASISLQTLTGTYSFTPYEILDAFISCIQPDGTMVWAKQFQAKDSFQPTSTLFHDGTLYTIGYFGVSMVNLYASGYYDIFIYSQHVTHHLNADFNVSDSVVWLGEKVTFSDQSSGLPTSWNWAMGDTITSNVKNPEHIYFDTGTYSVQVSVANLVSTDSIVKDSIIKVQLPPFSMLLSPHYNSLYTYGSVDSDGYETIAISDSMQVFAAGFFQGTVDLDPGPGENLVTSSALRDIIVTRFDSSLQLLSYFILRCDYMAYPSDMVIDHQGDIILTGYFDGVIDLDPGVGVANYTGNSKDVFIAKYSKLGVYKWGYAFGGQDIEYPYSLYLNDSNEIYLTSGINGIADIDPGPSVLNLNNSFCAKYSPDGELVNSIFFNSNGDVYIHDVAIQDNGDLFLCGYFTGVCDFDPGPGNYTLTASLYASQQFICKIKANNELVWVKSLGENLLSAEIELDHQGNLYMGGTFSGTKDFDFDTSSIYNLTSPSSKSIFIAKYDTSMVIDWAWSFKCGLYDQIPSLRLDSLGNILFTANLAYDVDFAPGPETYWVNSEEGTAVFVNLSSAGTLNWVKQLESTATNSINEMFEDSDGNIYACGTHQGTSNLLKTDFDPGPGEVYGISKGGYDAWLLRLAPYQLLDADFYASDTIVSMTDEVTFYMNSESYPLSQFWDFGDGTNSTVREPLHQYLDTGTYTVRLFVNDGISTDSLIKQNYIKVTNQLDCNVSINHVKCYLGNTGSILLSPANGLSPYTFQWQHGASSASISGLTVGTYAVTVQDSYGLVYMDSFLITQPDSLVLNYDIAHDYCKDTSGYIHLYPQGGIPPYTYYWSEGITSSNRDHLTGGVFTLYNVRDGNHCGIYNKSFEILVPPTPTGLSLSSTDLLCFNDSIGAIDISFSGGFADSLIYQWSNGETVEDLANLGAGIYSVTVSQATYGCVESKWIEIHQPDSVILNAIVTDSVCYGAIQLNPSGGISPFTFNWSNNNQTSDLMDIALGVYIVTVTDQHNCNTVATYQLLASQGSISIQILKTDISCFGLSDGIIEPTLVGGFPDTLSFLWNTGDTTQNLTGLPAGEYMVTVTQINHGCVVGDTVILVQPTEMLSNEIIENDYCVGVNSSISVNPSGSVPPYHVLWSTNDTITTIDSLLSGTYYLTVIDDLSCLLLDTFEVFNAEEEFGIQLITENLNCFEGQDGSISIQFVGGFPDDMQITWSNGATSESLDKLSAGMYSVSVQQLNYLCFAVDSVELIQSANLIDASEVNHLLCANDTSGSIFCSFTGGNPPYHLNWETGDTTFGISSLQSGIYKLTVTDEHHCDYDLSYEVLQPEPIDVVALIEAYDEANSTMGSISLTPSGGSPPYSFDWHTGDTTSHLADLAIGPYYLRINDANFCFTDTFFIVYDENETGLLQNYPNPFTNSTTILYYLNEDQEIDLGIYNAVGAKIQTLFVGSQSKGYHQIYVRNTSLATDIYYIILKHEDGVIAKPMIVLKTE